LQTDLTQKTIAELKQMADKLSLSYKSKIRKADLIALIADALAEEEKQREKENRQHQKKEAAHIKNRYKLKDNLSDATYSEGPVKILPAGYGIIERDGGALPVYVSSSQVQKFRVETGDILGGRVRSPKKGEKYAAMLFLEKVNGVKTADLIKKMEKMMNPPKNNRADRYAKTQTGVLDVNPEGYGFLRIEKNCYPGDNDVYVPANIIRRYNLRTGDLIAGHLRKSDEGEKQDALLYVETVNGAIPESIVHRPQFERLTPIFPREQISLETHRDAISARIIDLFAPIGKGQRGLIVAPPKSGKTTLLKAIANGVRQNAPDIKLMILLVDERPEEVTDMERSVDAEIIYSTFDESAHRQLSAAQMTLARAKRLVEQGQDVMILVDSLTRLVRGNNLVIEPSGRTLTGGLDPASLHFPKQFFGSARNIEGGGSLTIIATALVDTGSRMDDIIYEEFKGTGNMELHLNRDLAERRIYPAIDIKRSGTRREELLLSPEALKMSTNIRKIYGKDGADEMAEKIILLLTRTESNAVFLKRILKN
jgi:transcription termination factor Rho